MSWIIPLASQVVPALASGLSQTRQLKRQRKALDIAGQETEGQIKYRQRLEERAQTGDPMLQLEARKAMSGLRQVGREAQTAITGRMISRGLENSIITEELRKRQTGQTLAQISEQAERFAILNAKAKQGYEDQLMQYNISRDQKLQNIAMQRAGMATKGDIALQIGGQLVGAGLGSYGSVVGKENEALLGQAQGALAIANLEKLILDEGLDPDIRDGYIKKLATLQAENTYVAPQ
tara:strand:+ start:122 stop:829 length:708 start_codon:yes stop_codon:yes gene_type:complete